jgi:tRNA(adenine34) deaminase
MNENEVFEKVIELASEAARKDEVPIGAIIIRKGKLISSAHNETEKENSFLAHAEMLALKRACEVLGSKYLNECELYVSIEPCSMCLHAAKLSRITAIHYLLKSEKFGVEGNAYFKTDSRAFESESLRIKQKDLLREFFRTKRV